MSKGGGAPKSSGGGARLVFGGIGAPRKNDKITPGKPYVPKGTNCHVIACTADPVVELKIEVPFRDPNSQMTLTEIDELIVASQARIKEGEKRLEEIIGKCVPIVVDLQKIKDHTRSLTVAGMEGIISWFGEGCLDVLFSMENGIGGLCNQDFIRQHVNIKVDRLELEFEENSEFSDRLLSNIGLRPSDKKFVVTYNKGTLKYIFGPMSTEKQLKSVDKLTGIVLQVPLLRFANYGCGDATETLRMMVGKDINIEIDLWEAFKDPEPTPDQPQKKEKLPDSQKEKIATWISTHGLKLVLSDDHGIGRVLKDEKHAETIFQEKVQKIVLTFDRFPESFINDAFDIVVFAYDIMKDNRFRIAFEGGVLTMVFGEDFSTDDAKKLHLHIKKILGFQVETAVKNAKEKSRDLSKEISHLVGTNIVFEVNTDFQDEDKARIAEWLADDGASLVLSKEFGIGKIVQNEIGKKKVQKGIKKIILGYHPASKASKLAKSIDFLIPVMESKDEYINVTLEDEILNITFGSRLTVLHTRRIYRYINNLLRYSVEELGKIAKIWTNDLHKVLGKNVEVEIHFAKAALETDVDKVLLTTWLVDVGLGSLLGPVYGLGKLNTYQKSCFLDRVKKIFITYRHQFDDMNVQIDQKGTLTILYGTGCSYEYQQKTCKHLIELFPLEPMELSEKIEETTEINLKDIEQENIPK